MSGHPRHACARRPTPGLLAALAVLLVLSVAPAASAATKHVWIAVVPATWNVVPSGVDPLTGTTYDPADTTMQTIVYKRFTKNWARRTPNYPTVFGDNDGIPGPLIKARVGDRIIVHFKNMDTRFNHVHSMHFHGLRFPASSDGSNIPGVSGPGANVPVGGTFTYRLRAVRSSRGVWPYHDHASHIVHSLESGLYGAVSILGRNEPKPDHENLVFFGTHLGFQVVNGRAFAGNTPVFRAKTGQVVQWDVLALGGEFHVFHLHGHRWNWRGDWIDSRGLGSGESFRFRIREDTPGPWLYHCHVEFHLALGMVGLYQVGGRALKVL